MLRGELHFFANFTAKERVSGIYWARGTAWVSRTDKWPFTLSSETGLSGGSGETALKLIWPHPLPNHRRTNEIQGSGERWCGSKHQQLPVLLHQLATARRHYWAEGKREQATQARRPGTPRGEQVHFPLHFLQRISTSLHLLQKYSTQGSPTVSDTAIYGVLTAVTMKTAVLWDVTLCRLVECYQHLERAAVCMFSVKR
jgi:hypothetical protein